MRSQPIWHPLPSRTSPCIYARQEFIVSADPTDAWLQCACSAPFSVYLNGEFLGRGLGPVLTADPVWERFEIAPLLQRGDNLLLVLAGELESAAAPWFRAEAEITYADGLRAFLGTGRLWNVQRADTLQIYAEGPLSGVYFAAQEPANWTAGQFRPEHWEEAARVEGPQPLAWNPRPVAEVETWARAVATFGEVDSREPLRFVERPGSMAACKCVRREALQHSGRQQALVQTRNPGRAAYLVLDFGRLLSGFPRLRLRGPKGGVVDLGFARSWGQIESGLRYVSGEGLQEWTGHRLETARYAIVRLSNWPEETEIDSVSLVERRVQVPARGAFQATQNLERIWDTGQRTVDACRQEIYYLSPGPGPYDWLETRLFALDDFYLTGDSQTLAAMLASCHPPRPAAADIQQSLAYILCAADYYQYSGDRQLIRQRLPGILQILDDCARQADDRGLLTASTAQNALYAAALLAAAHLCQALRETDKEDVCQQAGQQVRQSLQAAWRPEQGLFADRCVDSGRGVDGDLSFSQWTNALILHLSVARGDQARQIGRQLQSAHLTPISDLPEAFFLAAGLWQAGADRQALEVVEQQWGTLLGQEGSTWGEKAARTALPEPAPGPEFFLGAELLGVKPGAPGYRILEIRPRLSGLEQASGHLLTGRGPVAVDWRHDAQQGRFTLRAELAEEGETHLAIPRLNLRFPTLTLNGQTIWRNEKVYPNAFVRELISEDEHIVLVLHKAGVFEVEVV